MELESVTQCPLCSSPGFQTAEPSFNICACNCGFVFDNPRPTLNSIASFYSDREKYDPWIANEKGYEKLWERRLKLLQVHAQPGNLLDVGAGIGQFLAKARPHFTSVYGTEVSSSGAKVAHEKYSIDLIIGDIHTLNLPAASYQNITLFHILEHVHDPVALLAECRRLLCEGGTLMVCVPNDVLDWRFGFKAWGRRRGWKRFKQFSPRSGLNLAGDSREIHLSHFTPKTLRSAMEKAGFKVRTMALDPFYAASGLKAFVHTCYFRLHETLYRLSGWNHYVTILAVGSKA
jgi:ubiquinone/menaquinone biosynthesis C-methylase UbiE